MKRPLGKVLFGLLACVCVCTGPFTAKAAYTVRANTDPQVVQVEFHSMLDVSPQKGFAPVRISVTNRSSRTASWQFDFRSGQQTGDMNVFSHAVRVELGAGESRIVEVMCPVYPVPATHQMPALTVHMIGPGIERDQARIYSGGYQSSGRGALMAMSASIANRNKSAVEQMANTGSGRGVTQVATLHLDVFSEDVRGFSGVDVLLMTPEEWEDLDGGQRYTLTQWIAQGGHLFLVGEPGEGVPQSLRNRMGASETLGLGWGSVRMFSREGGAILDAGALLREAGQALILDPQVLNMDFSSRNWALRREIRDLRRPVGLIMITVIAVAVLLGPVNVMVALRRQRPVQLLWVTPLLSVCLSLCMIVVILLLDGFGGKGLRSLTVFLLPEHNLEVVRQEQVSRTGVLLNREMRLPRGAVMQMLNVETQGVNQFANRVSGRFDLLGDETWRGNWFASRAIQGQSLQLSRPNRAQLTLFPGQDGAPPELLSSLDVNLEVIFLRDFEGRHWTADQVRAGSRVRLEPATEREANTFQQGLTLRTQERVAPVSGAGTFLAQATPEDGQFLDTLSGIRWDNHRVRYTGLLVQGGGQ